ncbi:putative membrane protein [Bifidobacterium saguini DSM 23967]|uniref:YhgE/Pip domain-containing protein n=2 Tax=Bifidobacterium saguini TaxID=762210 RepID=A0ABX7SD26_9BIFI|nr:YhgE/Pip domain-containing protein [Bifidobacterium saguini]KFI92313.1 putative membrane protein [Bifidobacterium saguini DSM 23967]QTB91014.1 YhgE/Pip domain-containing protein [Bifidobacterium saguini]
MRNVWIIFRNDMKRIRSSVIALIIAIGLILMPSFYAWFNIYANWNPYNNTSGMKVAVANSDKGYQGDMLPAQVNVGDQVANALRANDSLDWTFVSETEAKNGVKSGEYYAAIVIPKDFSTDLFSMLNADDSANSTSSTKAEQAKLLYYANPKKNPIGSTVTNQGASTVRQQINDTLTSAVAKAAAGTLDSVTSYLDEDYSARSISTLSTRLRQQSTDLANTAQLASNYADLVDSAAALLDASSKAMGQTKDSLGAHAVDANNISSKLSNAADAADKANTSVINGLDAAADAFDAVATNVETALGKPADGAANTAASLRDISKNQVQPMIKSLTEYRSTLVSIRDSTQTEPAKAAIDRAIADVDRTIKRLNDVDAKINDAAGKAESKSQSITDAAKDIADQARAGAQSIRDVKRSYQENVVASLSGVIDSAKQAGKDAAELLNDTSSTLTAVTQNMDGQSGALSNIRELSGNLGTVHDTLLEQSNKLGSTADSIDKALASGGVDAVRKLFSQPTDTIALAMSTPVSMKRIAVYPVSNNGSSMTPFYTLLAIWVGVMFLGIILKTNVSVRIVATLDRPKAWQLYLGRGLTFVAFSLAQTTVLGLGDLLYLRAQADNPFLFMLCLWWSSFVCSMFIYTLAAVFGNPGKALCALLMVSQIAGIGGTFPVEILPTGFRQLYPYLPFSHAITALRETVGGFYGNVYWEQMGRMGVYLAVALLIGLMLYEPVSRAMTKTNKLLSSTVALN